MRILNGKETAESIKLEIAEEVKARLAAGKSRPHLAAVLVGENGASLTYVNAKVKACAKVGFESTRQRFPTSLFLAPG